MSFERGSLRLDAPATARVPPYLTWDPRVGAWRTEAINHLRLSEDAAAYSLSFEDTAARFFECPLLRPSTAPAAARPGGGHPGVGAGGRRGVS